MLGARLRPIEIDRNAVRAEAGAVVLPRAVGEDVPQVAVATRAADLRPAHAEGIVLQVLDRVRQRLAEARPAAAVVELCAAVEERVAAGGTAIGALLPDG